MVIAHWQLKFSSGEILQSFRVYTSNRMAARYLTEYLIRRYIAPRWEDGRECIEYGYSIRETFEPPISVPGEYDVTVRGSRLFHPIRIYYTKYKGGKHETKGSK